MKNTWQMSDAPQTLTIKQLSPTSLEKLWTKISRRDRLETIASVAMIPVFGFATWQAFSEGQWSTAIFALLITAAVIWIPFKLRATRKLRPAPDPQQNVLAFLRAELAAVQAQARLARAAWLWYVAPIAVGVIGFYTSVAGWNADSLGYAVIVVVVGIAIHALNAYGAAPKFDASARELEEQIRHIEDTPS
ncbi:MAG: hypothetical protein AAF004_13420 [Pseudomonadota bacterium]